MAVTTPATTTANLRYDIMTPNPKAASEITNI